MSPNPSNFEERLTIVADTFAALIAADPWLSTAPAVPVMTERKGDIGAMITQALAKIGMSIAVVMPDAISTVDTGTDLSLRVRLVAQIDELVLVNQSAAKTANIAYRSALSAVLRVMKAIQKQPNGLDVAGRPHTPRLNEFFLKEDEPFRLMPDARYVTYHVNAYSDLAL